MIIRLLMTNSETNQWVYLEGAQDYIIGREESDFIISDIKCSRRHAVLSGNENGELRVRDLKSSNGTIVNQVKVDETKLKPNDVLKIGSTILLILEFENETIKNIGKASIRFETVDENGPRATEPNALEPQTKNNNKVAPPASEILHGWPNNIRSLPKDALKNFVDHFDEDQRKKSRRLIDLLKSKERKAS